jgi:putative membrane protein
MAELLLAQNPKFAKRLIWGISLTVPVLVGILVVIPQRLDLPMSFISLLPGLHALVNSLTALVLLLALWAIRKKNIALHRNLMLGAIGLGALFLISYVLYHASVDSTVFGDLNADGVRDAAEAQAVEGTIGWYYFVLLTHILLAAVVLPFVLVATYLGLNRKDARHRKVVRWAFPIWLYVSVSGVIVYLMISPYYAF